VVLDTFRDTITTIVLESGAHVKRRSPTFPFAMLDDKWVSLSLEITSKDFDGH
jgi:hypothetical protein